MVGAYRTDFTAWGLNANQELDDSEVHVPPALYGVAPLAIFGAVCVLGLLFVESNLRVEPMELLSGRED